MVHDTLEISSFGQWIHVPAFHYNGLSIIVRGKWVKLAIINGEEWMATELDDPEACVTALKKRHAHDLRADIFTFAQKLPSTRPRYDYHLEWDSVAAVRTTNVKDWWDKLPQETRKNVRRAEKRGVTVEVRALDDQLVADLVELNNDSAVRQGRRFVHYGKTVDQVRKDQSSYLERSDFICAYWEHELIGFMKIVLKGDVASILQFLPKASHADKRPANAMLAKAMEVCQAKGVSYLTYGLYNYGNKQDSPLRDFKRRNGFEEVLVPRFYVPLTAWGRMCVKLGLHKGYLGVLPRSVIRFGTSVRAKWYRLSA